MRNTMELVDEKDKILKTVCEEYGEITEETKKLVYDMIVIMQEHDGIGLAAPQVGVNKRLFVVGHKETGFVVCINPSYEIAEDSEIVKFQEGCLSFPHLEMKVPRHTKILTKFTDLSGNSRESLFTGVWAQAFQHEYDHLEGITFDTRAGATSLNLGMSKRKNKLKKLARKNNK